MKPDERAQLIVRSAIDYMTDRMTAMKEQEGNPMGVDILQLGEAVAYYSRNMPWPMFNHVKGELAPEDADDAIDFYESRGREGWHRSLHICSNGAGRAQQGTSFCITARQIDSRPRAWLQACRSGVRLRVCQ